MAGTKQASPRARPRLHTQLGRALALPAACLLALTATARAGELADCSAVNAGGLNLEMSAAASAMRTAELKAGDTLIFRYAANPGTAGTITVLGTAATPRLLLSGPTGASATFVAAVDGPVAFAFALAGDASAMFSASCIAVSRAADARGTAPKPLRNKTGRLARWGDVEVPPEPEDTPAALAPPDLDLRAKAPGIVVEQPTVRLPKDMSAAEMQLRWRDPRLRPALGPNGPEVDGNASGVNIGLNMKVQPGFTVGALAQFDQPGEQSLAAAPRSLLDQGWMFGPVANLRLGGGLSLEAQAAWGVTQVAPDEMSARIIGAPRSMVSARLANVQAIGPWRLTPSLSVSHFQDTLIPAAVPAHSVAETMAGQHSVGFGRVDVGPEVAYRIDLDGPLFIEPRAAIGQFWSFDSLSDLAPGSGQHVDPRVKAEAGVTVGASDGMKLQAAGGVEKGEVGVGDTWSGRLQLSVPMK